MLSDHAQYTTPKEIAEALTITSRAVLLRAESESWPVAGTRPGRGGGKLYLVAELPQSYQVALMTHRENALEPVGGPPAVAQSVGGGHCQATPKQQAKAAAKAELLKLYLTALEKAGWGKKDAARKKFLTQYKAGVWPNLLETLGPKISWKTIEKWKKAVQGATVQGASVLVDTRGARPGVSLKVTEEIGRILISKALHPNRLLVSEVIRDARDDMDALQMEYPGDAALRNFLKFFKEREYAKWVYIREGLKAWMEKCAYYVDRNYDAISVGDILVGDGHKLNFDIKNPATGKGQRMELILWYDMRSNYPLGWEIMPTEDTMAIASAFRRACIRLGKYPKVAYIDNGRAFKAKYFVGVDLSQIGLNGLFSELGVEYITAWPYHGQSKTVERFFGTFAELERKIPSYVGTCIAKKPPRLHRNEKLHKKIYEAAGGRAVTMEEAHKAIAMWFDKYVERPQPDGHLEGKAPADLFDPGRGSGVDVRQLDYLMMAKERKRIVRSQIKHEGRFYYAPELYSRAHNVVVRYDRQKPEKILVYMEDGTYLCEALEKPKVHPAARQLGTAEDQALLEEQLAIIKGQEKLATKTAREFVDAVVVPETKQKIASMAIEKTRQAEPAPEPKLSKTKVKSIEAEIAQRRAAIAAAPAYTPPEQRRDIISELDKYEYLFELLEKDGVDLRDADREWMSQYEASDEFLAGPYKRYEQLRNLYARQRGKNTVANAAV